MEDMGYDKFFGCVCVFAPHSTAGIRTRDREGFSQTPGIPLFSEQLNVYVLGQAAKTET